MDCGKNMTKGTAADGFCTFGNLCYYSITNGADECLPMVFVQLPSTSQTGDPVTFNYVDGGCVFSTEYTVTPSPILLVPLGINEHEKPAFSVSANYPNPFSGSTMVDVTLTKSTDVTIEVSNMV